MYNLRWSYRWFLRYFILDIWSHLSKLPPCLGGWYLVPSAIQGSFIVLNQGSQYQFSFISWKLHGSQSWINDIPVDWLESFLMGLCFQWLIGLFSLLLIAGSLLNPGRTSRLVREYLCLLCSVVGWGWGITPYK